MDMIRESLRGERPLWKVFWIYGVGFIFFVVLAFRLLFSVVSKNIAVIIGIPAIVILLAYYVWLLASVWNCAKNSKPLWNVLARLWVVIGLVGLANMANEMLKHF